MSVVRRISKLASSSNSRNQIYHLHKYDGKIILHFDENALHRVLKDGGVPEQYRETVTSVMKEAAEDFTKGCERGEEYRENLPVLNAAFQYLVGAGFIWFGLKVGPWFPKNNA